MWTSAVWPSSRMVSTMPSAVSGLTKQDAASAGVASAGMTQRVGRLHRPVLGVHRAAEDRDGLAQQRLGRGRRPGLDHHARAFVADRQRLADPRRPSPA